MIESIDAKTIYQVPNLMLEQGLDTAVLRELHLPTEGKPDLTEWNQFLQHYNHPKHEITIGLVGKYKVYTILINPLQKLLYTQELRTKPK